MKQTVKQKTFLKPDHLLEEVGVSPDMVVADFGCGNGHYSVAAGTLVGKKGQVHAFDLLEDALSQTASFAKLMGLNNVSTKLCDLERVGGCGLKQTSCDLVIISSLLHQLKNKDSVLREAYRILKTGGWLLVVEWRRSASLGPHQGERIAKADVEKLLEQHSFRPERELDAGSFHYALLYSK